MDIDIRTLLGRLNPECKRAMTQAAERCVRQTHFNVEIEHLLSCLLDPLAPDLGLVLEQHGLKLETVQAQLQTAQEGFKRGNGRTPALSPHFAPWFQEAWLMSSMLLGEQQVRSGTLLLALLEVDSLRGVLIDSAPSLLDIPRGRLREQLPALLAFFEGPAFAHHPAWRSCYCQHPLVDHRVVRWAERGAEENRRDA